MNILEPIAYWIVLLFGSFFIFCGFVMLLTPEQARATIYKAGSTTLINYGEISLRMIPAAALILIADQCKHPLPFEVMGWFMLATSLVLFFVPHHIHHSFAAKGADMLNPILMRLVSPIAMIAGMLIIYNALPT
jgi:hypothetical protein